MSVMSNVTGEQDEAGLSEAEGTQFRNTGKSAAGPREGTETPLEALSSICAVLAVGLFVLMFIFQNFVIPSGSMEKTLLVGDHVLVDRTTFAPPARWAPFVRYREPQRGDVIVFYKPNPETA